MLVNSLRERCAVVIVRFESWEMRKITEDYGKYGGCVVQCVCVCVCVFLYFYFFEM